MAAQATMSADPVSAVAQAVGAIAGTVSTFVSKAAQRYGLTKSMEANTVAFEQSKTLAAYQGLAESRKIAMYGAVAILFIVVLAFTFKRC